MIADLDGWFLVYFVAMVMGGLIFALLVLSPARPTTGQTRNGVPERLSRCRIRSPLPHGKRLEAFAFAGCLLSATAVARVTGYSAYWVGQIARRSIVSAPTAYVTGATQHNCTDTSSGRRTSSVPPRSTPLVAASYRQKERTEEDLV